MSCSARRAGSDAWAQSISRGKGTGFCGRERRMAAIDRRPVCCSDERRRYGAYSHHVEAATMVASMLRVADKAGPALLSQTDTHTCSHP